MESRNSVKSSPTGFMGTLCRLLALATCILGLAMNAAAQTPMTINVLSVKPDGSTVPLPSNLNYRWTVEEDATKASVPGKPADKSNYSFSFHTSYMPVIAAGRVGLDRSGVVQDPDVARLYNAVPPTVCANGAISGCLNPAKRYYVSVAADKHQMGGAPVVINGSTASATVYVNQYDLPTAQLSVFAFEDNNPINGAPDLPQETGLAGFTVQLFEAGGTYGQSGGAVTQDAFANPLGTTYNADGSVKAKGKGIIFTGPDGTAVIKNLFPAKYTIVIVPPVGSDWHQTSTIEGGFGSDAWVKNNEPSFFQEFGPPGHHVFIGFTRSGFLAKNGNAPVLNGNTKVTGRVVSTHHSRPPIYTFYSAAPVNDCWVGLNEANGGRALYATACNKDSTFTIPNVPNGTYELVIWDTPLDTIISATTITVSGETEKALGNLPVSSWFARYQGRVFQDIDGTGLPFFDKSFDRPYIEVDAKTGLEKEVTKKYAAGDLKPSFGQGIASNIRFRDGSIYQSTTTKQDGTFAFTELFPFFNWMVAEIDYARFKASGATMVVDEGGEVDPAANVAKLWGKNAPYTGLFSSNDPALAYNPWIRLNPQEQADGKFYRTENCADSDAPGQCAILLEGMQTFLSQTNHIEWGKQPYGFNENGGIAGIVHYAITRAEDDPRYAAAENWEPGIPRVQVNLFLDCDGDGKPDQPANDGTGACKALSSDKNYKTAGSSLAGGGYAVDLPDVDNYPFGWSDGGAKGPEDVKRSRTGDANTFSFGDVFKWGAPGADTQNQIGLTSTDSWDDKPPTGCPGYRPSPGLPAEKFRVPTTGEELDCYDGLRNFNQLRPAVFDGGYAFGRVAGQPELPMFIGTAGKGTYIVEAVAPPGYLHQGNGDKNVVFGDSLKASTAALPFECVGQELPVPKYLTLFPDTVSKDNVNDTLNPNWSAGATWKKCDMKAVPLVPGTNPAPDFHMFTEAPVAGHGVGFILDDTATEFNQYAPTFGEKYSPPHLPVSVQDWTGREITRVYSDQFGSYNFLVPSSFTINPPFPSGVMPSMMVACMNHPGPITNDPVTGAAYATPQIDPYFNRNYTQFCYTLQYLPGKTTYLDTPVLPVSAFAAVDKNPLDCECADGTPAIYSATNGDNGPWVPSNGGKLNIVSQGKVDVVNPAFDPSVLPPGSPNKPACSDTVTTNCVATDAQDTRLKKAIQRDYSFGKAQGTVKLGAAALTVDSWTEDLIVVNVPAGAATGQLTITRGGPGGKETVVGLTVHVGTLLNNNQPKKVNLAGAGGAYKTIQEAIDSVTLADSVAGRTLITIAPGTYPEFVIMDKRVSLQGWGAGSVTINASKPSAGGLAAWRALLAKKVNSIPDPTGAIDADTGQVQRIAGPDRTFDPLPGQTIGFNAANNEPILFAAEEAPGVLVVDRGVPNLLAPGEFVGCVPNILGRARLIDGLTVTGSDSGGGILANGFACDLQVSNNRVVANYGTYGGGIRIGHTTLTTLVNDVDVYTDAFNRAPKVHHNWVAQNGATENGGAGGITLGTGSDGYSVSDNYICGNFSMADGGGLAHMGLSRGTNTIANNKFIFNQTFNQSADPTGAGLFIGGLVPVGGGNSEGTGNVDVLANVFTGNQAGSGAGGGVSVVRTRSRTNGNTTVVDAIRLTNNMIVNNVAAYAGGGVYLNDNANNVRLTNNTVASNTSTATNRQSFPPLAEIWTSYPQISGVAVGSGSNPQLLNNILWGNRSYVFQVSNQTNPAVSFGLFDPGVTIGTTGTVAQYRDLGRIDFGALTADYSVLTIGGINLGVTASNTTSVASDSTTLFIKKNDFASVNDPNQPLVLADATVALKTALTFDETGNFINVIFQPLTLWEPAPGPNGFVDVLRADYHLTATSEAVDKGQAATASNSVPARDIDGDVRVGTVDVGADELRVPQADLSITNTDGRTTVSQGDTLTYTITVSNNGPDAVSGATVTDNFPAGLTVNTWSCAASAGSSCTASGTGSGRGGVVNLPVGGTATFTATATVGAQATGSLANIASVGITGTATPLGIIDPVSANNSATDLNAISQKPALTVLDNFNRGNANTLGGNWNQLTAFGVASIRVNNQQASDLLTAGAAYWNGTGSTFAAKQAAAFTFANTTLNNDGLVLKASGGTNEVPVNYVRVRYSGTAVVVQTTTTAGVAYTDPASLPATFANGDTLSAMVDANGTVLVWKTTGATTTLVGYVASTFTGTGRIGMQLPNGARVDNFAGGTVP
jgi:uncharacterized repeat protein (TIGR01451 family)